MRLPQLLTHRILGLIIATVFGIIALTTTAPIGGLTLHKEIKTAEFIRGWHKHSTELWTQQNKTDSDIVYKIADLRQDFILLGDQAEILKEQIKLKCDWDVTCYCIIRLKFSNSK